PKPAGDSHRDPGRAEVRNRFPRDARDDRRHPGAPGGTGVQGRTRPRSRLPGDPTVIRAYDAVVTAEFHPGFRNSVAAYTVSLLQPKVIRELRLAEHGLKIIERPISNFLP